MRRRKGFIFGDLHFPFHSQAAVDAALKGLKSFDPDYVVQIGDLYDFFSFSRFARGQNTIKPEEEINTGRVYAEEFWKKVQASTRKGCKYYQILGNHDIRAIRRVIEKCPELESLIARQTRELHTFKGVKTIHDPREELIIDDICYTHGHKKMGQHLNDVRGRYNVVCGHIHRGGAVYINYDNKVFWELNVGFLADKDSKALSYSALKRFSAWTLGWGEIDEQGPRFIPIT